MRLGAIPDLPAALTQSLEEHGIKTDAILLSMSPLDILRRLPLGSITLGEINHCKRIAARVSAAPGQSATSLLKLVPQKLPSMNIELPLSLEPVNLYLSPHTDKVVELSGDRNSRRSEFILNIVLRYLATNTHSVIHWVDTVGGFSATKASNVLSRLEQDSDQNCLDRIKLSLALEVEQLYDILDELVASLDANDGVSSTGYLIVDSATALFGPLLSVTSSQGHALMIDLMRRLRVIAQTHFITVVNDSISNFPDPRKSIRKPALGPSFTFLTDATLWMATSRFANDSLPATSNTEPSDCVNYHLEVTKSNFGAVGTIGSFLLWSGLYLLPHK